MNNTTTTFIQRRAKTFNNAPGDIYYLTSFLNELSTYKLLGGKEGVLELKEWKFPTLVFLPYESIPDSITDMSQRKKLLYSCLLGLHSEFTRGVIHDYFTPSNILTKDDKFVLSDYEGSIIDMYPSRKRKPYYSDDYYIPPEISFPNLYDDYGFESSIWILGMCYYHICTNDVPDGYESLTMNGFNTFASYIRNKFLQETDNMRLADKFKNIESEYNKFSKLMPNPNNFQINDQVLQDYSDRIYKEYRNINRDILDDFVQIMKQVVNIWDDIRDSYSLDTSTLSIDLSTKLISKEEYDILSIMLSVDPQARSTPAMLLNNPMFDSIRQIDIDPEFPYEEHIYNYYMDLDPHIPRVYSKLSNKYFVRAADRLNEIGLPYSISLNCLYILPFVFPWSYTTKDVNIVLYLMNTDNRQIQEFVLPEGESTISEILEVYERWNMWKFPPLISLFKYAEPNKEISSLTNSLILGLHLHYDLRMIFNLP